MLLTTFLPALAALLSLCPSSALAVRKPSNSVLLSSIQTLTLRANQKTSHRRVSAIPQLTCSGPGCKHYDVDIMRCKNAGSDYDDENIQWTCTASLPEEFKLGSTDVICEGYDSPEDPYVLKGSCGVNYRLLLTEIGKEKYGEGFGSWFGGGGASKPASKRTAQDSGEGLGGMLFTLIFLSVLAWILYSMWASYRAGPAVRRPARQGGGGYGGWGGGAGGGDDDSHDPPPPYPGKPSSSRRGAAQEGWRPGFWSGALGGAAAGYMAGNRGQGGRQGYAASPPSNNGGGWFGNSDNGWGAGPSRPSTRSSGSSSRHESTGFGSTSRR